MLEPPRLRRYRPYLQAMRSGPAEPRDPRVLPQLVFPVASLGVLCRKYLHRMRKLRAKFEEIELVEERFAVRDEVTKRPFLTLLHSLQADRDLRTEDRMRSLDALNSQLREIEAEKNKRRRLMDRKPTFESSFDAFMEEGRQTSPTDLLKFLDSRFGGWFMLFMVAFVKLLVNTWPTRDNRGEQD